MADTTRIPTLATPAQRQPAAVVPAASPAPFLYLREDALREGLELMFHAQRDLAAVADPVLAEAGLGRAHHRAIYFIGRHPGLTVSALLGILGITKQSLGRVLKELVARGLVDQKPGAADRRTRLLTLTDAGAALEQRLTEAQRARLAHAWRQAGPDAVSGHRQVLRHLIDAPTEGDGGT